jgi:peptidylprolyl isomerase
VPLGLGDSTAAPQAKRKKLDELIEQRLLVAEAVGRGLDKDAKIQQSFAEVKSNILMGQLYREEIIDKSKPTDADVKLFYQHLEKEVRASHILVKTKEEAEDILKAIKSGGKFEELARQKSIDPGSGQQGGDLGWFGWGRMVEPFQQQAFKLQPGRLSPPVKTPFGYHIIRVDSVRPAEREPFDKMRDKITQQIQQTKPRELTARYVEQIKDNSAVKVKPEVLALLAAKQGPDGTLPQLPPDDLKKTVVAYRGGSWTVQQLYDNVAKYFAGRMDFKNGEAVSRQVEGMIINEQLVNRAKAKGLEGRPQVKTQLKRVWNDMLANAVYQKEVQGKVAIDSAAVKRYYDEHRKEYYQPAQVFVNLITVKTKPEAEAICAMLAKGADFAALAKERSIDWTKNNGGALGFVNQGDQNFPEITRAAFAQPLNQASRPFAVRDGWAVIKVTQKNPAVQRTFAQVQRDAESTLRQAEDDRQFQLLLAELRKKHPVKVDEAVLAKAGEQRGRR